MTYGFSGLNKSLNTNKNNGFGVFHALKAGSVIISARVISIILDDSHPRFKELGGWNSLGVVEYELVDKPTVTSTSHPIAFPSNPNGKNYPLINEIIYVISLPDTEIGITNASKKPFYINIVSLWNHPHHNAYPSISNEPAPPSQKDYIQTQAGSVKTVTDNPTEVFLGKTFKERTDIHPLLPFEGDVIQEGRWGNSIRLGSTVSNSPSTISNNWSSVGTNGDPLTIIRNGQGQQGKEGWIPIVENVNNDDSSIYLASTQNVPLNASSTSYVSYKDSAPDVPSKYSGKQILLNSGRLVFNSSNDHILLSSAKSINLNSIDSVNVDTTKMVVQANNIYLGNETVATEPLLLGNATVNLLGTLIQTLKQFSEVLKTQSVTSNAVPGSPSDIPAFRIYGTVLSTMMDSLDQQLNDITSKRNFTA